jgi:hypothetical protein
MEKEIRKEVDAAIAKAKVPFVFRYGHIVFLALSYFCLPLHLHSLIFAGKSYA